MWSSRAGYISNFILEHNIFQISDICEDGVLPHAVNLLDRYLSLAKVIYLSLAKVRYLSLQVQQL